MRRPWGGRPRPRPPPCLFFLSAILSPRLRSPGAHYTRRSESLQSIACSSVPGSMAPVPAGVTTNPLARVIESRSPEPLEGMTLAAKGGSANVVYLPPAGTLIIVPPTLTRQWISEFEKHAGKALSVFHYEGVGPEHDLKKLVAMHDDATRKTREKAEKAHTAELVAPAAASAPV